MNESANDSKYMRGTVTERHDLTSELWTIRVRPEETLVFTPGQYVTVGLPCGASVIERPYSLVSSGCELELEFFLELVPGGQLTPRLHDVGVGGEVLLRRTAKGRFGFDAQSGHPNHLLVATVTGVAPFVSILRGLVLNSEPCLLEPKCAVLLHGASVSAELGYSGEISAYSRRCEWFHYVPTVSRGQFESTWQGELGRVDDVVRKHTDKFGLAYSATTAYLCGHPQMIENVRSILQRVRFQRCFIQEEMYWRV